MAITITRDLNVFSVGVPPVIHLSQYDSDFTLVFNLYASTGAFTMPTGTTAEIRGTKRDGNGYDAAASVSGSTVTVTGDEQMTAIAGQNMFEIATYYNNKRLNTINFILDVERAALDADTITSESVLRELDAIIQGAATATQAAEDAEDAADRAEEAADDLSGTVQQVATNTQDIAGLKDDLDEITEGGSETIYIPIEFTCPARTETSNGLTFEQLADKTAHVYGTSTASGWTVFMLKDLNLDKIPFALTAGKTYRLKGCPSGGGESTYQLGLRLATGGNIYNDYGDGVIFEISENNTYYVAIRIASGITIDAIFAPEVAEQEIIVSDITAIDLVAREDIAIMQEEIDSFEGISDNVKVALLDCFAHVAWIDEHGQEYYDALESALYEVVSISAVYTQSSLVYTTDTLDSLKENLVVTAIKSDSTQEVIPANKYVLSGTLIEGTSTITVSYKNKTTTFDVIVTDARVVYELSSGFDLTGKAIDTGVTVFGQDANYTILIDVNIPIIPSDKTMAYALNHRKLTSGTLRLGFDKDNSNILHFIDNVMYADSYVDTYTPGNISALTAHNLIWIVRMSNKTVRKVFFCDNSKLLDKTENVSSYMSDKNFTGNYFIGSQTNTTPEAYTFPGTVNLFKIYNTVLDISEIEAILDITL